MTLDDDGPPIHKDATAMIRSRIFLEGNFFVDLRPGTPSAPNLDDGDTLAGHADGDAGAARPALDGAPDQRPRVAPGPAEGLRRRRSSGKPTAADDADAGPDVKGESAAQAAEQEPQLRARGAQARLRRSTQALLGTAAARPLEADRGASTK